MSEYGSDMEELGFCYNQLVSECSTNTSFLKITIHGAMTNGKLEKTFNITHDILKEREGIRFSYNRKYGLIPVYSQAWKVYNKLNL